MDRGPRGLQVVPYRRLMQRHGMRPVANGNLDAPKPSAAEISKFYRLHDHWPIADEPLPPPWIIHRRTVEPVITAEEAHCFQGTGIDKMKYDEAGDVEVSLQRIDNAVVIPAKQGFCLLQQGRIHALSPSFPMFRRHKFVIEQSFKRIVYTADAYTTENIAHYLLAAIVRGYFARQYAGFREDEIAFSESKLPYCEYFRSLAFADARRMEWGKAYHVEELYVFPRLQPAALRVFRPAIEFLSGLAGPPAAKPPDRLVYISRRDRPRRSLVNEPELEARLVDLGFEAIVAGELSPQDQIAAFRDAAMVVAPHGAALTNVLFMTEGARLLELKSPLTGTLTFHAISKLRGIDYQYIMGMADNAENGTWSIDVDDVIACVRGFLEAPETAPVAGWTERAAPARSISMP